MRRFGTPKTGSNRDHVMLSKLWMLDDTGNLDPVWVFCWRNHIFENKPVDCYLNAAIESTASSKKSSAPANDHQFVNVHGWLYRKLLIHNPDFKNYISIPSEILQQSPLTLFFARASRGFSRFWSLALSVAPWQTKIFKTKPHQIGVSENRVPEEEWWFKINVLIQ